MRIVVLGAGTVGTSIAEMLCDAGHSVTVVDNDEKQTKKIYDQLDVRTVTGSASQTSVMFQAEISTCDICLAVTGDDEVNIVAGSIAKAMGARRSVARVYAPVFRDLSTFDYQTHFNIDRLLSLEHLTAMELAREIRSPGSVVVENFARGELEIQEVVLSEKSSVLGKPLFELGLPTTIRIGSIYRNGRMWIPKADDRLEASDRLGIIGRPADVEKIKGMFQKGGGHKQRVMIAGGGETGYHLARALENDRFSVLLMESDPSRCEHVAAGLKRATVVQCDATSRLVLEEEHVAKVDIFVACTGDDENNIIAGVEARELGAEKILAIVGRPDYANIVGKLGIDRAVSEREVMAKQIMGFLNSGPVITRMLLPGGTISVYEVDVLAGALATEHPLKKLPLPKACLIAAVMRKGFAHVPGADTQLAAGDTAVLFVEEDAVKESLKMFEANDG